jgi:hypothetical protein
MQWALTRTKSNWLRLNRQPTAALSLAVGQSHCDAHLWPGDVVVDAISSSPEELLGWLDLRNRHGNLKFVAVCVGGSYEAILTIIKCDAWGH